MRPVRVTHLNSDLDFFFSSLTDSSETSCHRNCLLQVIDASQSVEDVHKNITTHSLNTVEAAQNLPLGELWK